MKYSESNPPIVCMQTNSLCYKNTGVMKPKGVLWHDTSANNTKVARYVQPMESDPNYSEMIALIGSNRYKNDWNHKQVQKGVNAFIGHIADGSVAAVQCLPWDYQPWGCGGGKKGSLNYTHMQFEICADDLTNQSYFEAVYKEACELTAYYCKMFNLDPLGTFVYKGVVVPVITSHKESHDLGFGSNHGDPIKWLKKFGKSMDDVRHDVAKLMSTLPEQKPDVDEIAAEFVIGEEVKLKAGATYFNGKTIPSWVYKKTLYVRDVKDSTVRISTQKTGAITGTVAAKNLIRLNAPATPAPAPNPVPTPAPAPAPTPVAPVVPKEPETLKLGDAVKLIEGAKWASGKTIASWVFAKTLYVRAINGDKITVSKLKTGAVTGTVLKEYLRKI